MATENLQIPDIQASQNQKEVTANAAHNLLDRAGNNNAAKTISGSTSFTTTETRENIAVELTGTPGTPAFIDMPDTNKRFMAVVNNTDDVMTIRNSVGGGTGQPVMLVGEASIFHYDGVDFFDFTALASATWLGLTDTPSSFTGESGRGPQVNIGETALEFVGTAAKRNVIAATTVDSALATTFENGDIIDGVTLVTGDRILIKDQTLGEENGIYIVQATGAPTRVEDFDDALDMQESPVLVPVLEGTANSSTVWIHTTTGTITVDTTALTFVNTATFLRLSDTPANFTNAEGRELRGNAAGDALEFQPKRWRDPVRVATAVAGTLATDFDSGSTVDGITLNVGDRILIKDQSAGAENGIYTVNAAVAAPTRVDDMDDNGDIVDLGAVVAVLLGDTNARSTWMHTAGTDIGTDTLTFLETEPTSINLARSYLAGLILSNNGTDAANDIDIAVGECRDDANGANMVLASALIKRIDAAWVAGTNQGGMDTGSVANDTWYHVWLIRRSDTGAVDVLFSLSATSPTFPTNYDEKRRIGAVRRATATNLGFSQFGNEFLLDDPPLDIDANNPGTSAVLRTLTVPSGVKVGAVCNAVTLNVGVGVSAVIYLSSPDVNDEVPSHSAAPLSQAARARLTAGQLEEAAFSVTIRVNTSSQIRSRLSGSDADITLRIATLGWIDFRGRDD